jgi:Na+/phosphate symporter
MSGHTNNPLVVGANVTTRSDARIFSSDGNATMKVFAQSPALFRSICASLVARMIDTVPRDVKLTEVIKPLPVKPDSLQLMHHKNNSFSLTGNVRVSFPSACLRSLH